MAKASDFEGKKPEELFYFVDYSPEEAERIGYSNYSYWGSVIQNFLKQKVAVFCLILFLALTVFSFIALGIGKYHYTTLISDSSKAFIKPNSEYWFGTDNLGRDYWCQVWYATQVSIRLALVVAVGESIVGVIFGLIWGYVRSLDRFFTELYNLIDNVPYIIYMTLIALMVGQSFWIMAISMIAINWLSMARRVRNMVFMFRDREYNLASRCLGTPLWRVLTKNILPYLVSVIILRMALSIPGTINLESTLSYLGLGLGIDTPSLGLILSKVRGFFLDYPYLLVFPASIVSIISMTNKYLGGVLENKNVTEAVDDDLKETVLSVPKAVEEKMDKLRVADAITEVFRLFKRCNKYIDETEPWVLGKDEAKKDRLFTVLYNLVESIVIGASLLEPFMPETTEKILAQLNAKKRGYEEMDTFGQYESGTKVTDSPEILFMRLDPKEVLAKAEEIKQKQMAEAKAESGEEDAGEEEGIDIEAKPEITFDDFMKMQFQVGEIIACEEVPKSKKLLCSQVKIGSEVKQIVSGIKKYYSPEEMVGKKVMVLVNLKPAKLAGVLSEGMLLCAEDAEGNLSLMTPEKKMPAGAEIC